MQLRQIETVPDVDTAFVRFYKRERRTRDDGQHDRLVASLTQELDAAGGEPVMMASRHDDVTGRVLYAQRVTGGIAVLEAI
jgi:hypothetical protein